ncbi:GNAT family N-acetyltransferase [Mariniradius sediminis]|uniref:GNAT family N-acetyltransferase n=1 Tax=Mariniradius sediminis TaxID=2909237 RepID=A0ABS9BP45_9BACT|nr:GNAT family N-acetyltransferase [Mariniradius sediminis]MCF1749792.1 GNAT family N-acetyltransferase [Mariniradius sediminis]
MIARKFTLNDLPLLETWLQTEPARKYFGVPEDWLHEIEANLDADWIHHFIVEDGKPFAFVQHYDAHLAPLGIWSEAPLGSAGIDFLIGELSFLGKGYGSKLVEFLVRDIRATGGFEHVVADPTPENNASIRLLEKAGFSAHPSGLYIKTLTDSPWTYYLAKETDIPEITDLFYNTIQFVNIKDYTKEQVDDWSYWHSAMDKWQHGIWHDFFVKAVDGTKIIGFGSLREDGYLDYLFTHKDHQHQGVGRGLYRKLENQARTKGHKSIYADVSITARNFFENLGFVVEEEQVKKSHFLELVNYRMRKALD